MMKEGVSAPDDFDAGAVAPHFDIQNWIFDILRFKTFRVQSVSI
jgi:hypothetical protein